MSIVIVRGPDTPPASYRAPLSQYLPPAVIASLVDSAVCAGKTLAIRVCGSHHEIVSALGVLDRAPPEILLLDPGRSLEDAGVQAAMRTLRVPFIEIHDNPGSIEEPALIDAPANRLCVVNGYMAQSYVVAMDKALEHLGCGACHTEYHVGT